MYYIIVRPPKRSKKLATSRRTTEKKIKQNTNLGKEKLSRTKKKMREKCKVAASGRHSHPQPHSHPRTDGQLDPGDGRRFKPKNSNCLVINKNGSHFGNRANSFSPHFMSAQRVAPLCPAGEYARSADRLSD